ncbi:hypothetical protein KZ483_18905 [Paenibacillus sp. sptzw28]|uniref:hypothetical protein n=1 Tax=Paenibacillus sp. sptzw28 TaxID=715179 RepID=UPI001C6E6D1E|nr:hypothetical protein [Paenibacillus sp. sptzw28]QYR19931.1 hypothetical protein KZ483_18905 [Paenibacillus sp. sptzw28]
MHDLIRLKRPRGRSGQPKSVQQLSDEVTSLLQKIVITLLIAVVLSQLALQIPQVRAWVTGVDRLEGTPFVQVRVLCIWKAAVV